MVKEYLFKVTKEQYIKVSATNKEDAYELAEENSLIDTRDEEVIDVELVDVYEEDIDDICDDYRLGMYDDMEEDVYDDEETINKYFYNTNEIFFRFISGQLIDAVVVGILVTIAMSIIGVKYSVLLGFMIGLFNMIPYFGAIVAVAISVLITVITGGLSQAIIMAVVVIILQQIDSNIINPKIIGSSLQISPLLVIFAVTLGGAYFGVLGMFLGVPFIAVLRIMINDWIDYRNRLKMQS